jgi:hypothetical protein
MRWASGGLLGIRAADFRAVPDGHKRRMSALRNRLGRHRLVVLRAAVRTGSQPVAIKDVEAAFRQTLTAYRALQPPKHHHNGCDYCRARRAGSAVDSHIVRRTVKAHEDRQADAHTGPLCLGDRASLRSQVLTNSRGHRSILRDHLLHGLVETDTAVRAEVDLAPGRPANSVVEWSQGRRAFIPRVRGEQNQ